MRPAPVTTNYQRVSEALRLLTLVLGPFVARGRRNHFSDRWWQTGVLDRLYENQRQRLPAGGKDDVLASSLDACQGILATKLSCHHVAQLVRWLQF